MFKNKTIIFVVGILLFIGIRFMYLPQAINFGSDEGRDFLTTWNIYAKQEFKLIGPPSQYSIDGRQFYFGPAPYYVILPALVIGKGDPLVVSQFLILLNASFLFIAVLILNTYIKEKIVVYLYAFFSIFTPFLVEYSRSYWNPHFMLPVSTLLLSLLVILSRHSRIVFVFMGFLFGLGLQFHYSFILAIILSVVWLVVYKRLNIRVCLLLTGGFIVGFLPVILFEVRNNFYNITTFFMVFKHAGDAENGFRLHVFYFISLMPFFFLLLSVVIGKIKKISHILFYIFIGFYTLWSLFTISSVPEYTLNYPTLQKVSQVIEKDRPPDFNILDQLTRDNRAMALRYMLTIHGFSPKDVVDYKSPKTLYMYSRLPLEQLLVNPIWEIKEFLPFNNVTTWSTDNGIFIYKLAK